MNDTTTSSSSILDASIRNVSLSPFIVEGGGNGLAAGIVVLIISTIGTVLNFVMVFLFMVGKAKKFIKKIHGYYWKGYLERLFLV